VIERKATVRNGAGIHCRPSTLIVERMREYDGKVCVRHDGEQSDLRSVVSLMALGLEQGEAVAVQVSGRDEEEICGQLVELFETRFDFAPRSHEPG
jgi:phosphotransferase system HPr (HPr) family protein